MKEKLDELEGAACRSEELAGVHARLEKLAHAASVDLERVAAGKVRERDDLAVVRMFKHMQSKPHTSTSHVHSHDYGQSVTGDKQSYFVDDAAIVDLYEADSVVAPEEAEVTVPLEDVLGKTLSSEVRRSTWTGVTGMFDRQDSDIATAAEMSNCYFLKESVWDASLLMGYSRLGVISNLLLALGFLMNVTLQAMFCILVLYLPYEHNAFSSDGIEAFRTWYAETDALTRQRVCAGDPSLTTSFHQLFVVEEAADYTTVLFEFLSLEQGPVLCSVVLFTWFLNMCNALQNVGSFVTAVTLAHKRDSMMLCLQEVLKNDKSFAISDIPTLRVCWVIFVGALQLGIAVTLMICGGLWLVASTRNTDLFLNTLALAYIMDIDELVFMAVVPRELHYIISNTDGLRLSSRNGCFRAIPLRTSMTFFSLALTFSMFYHLKLVPVANIVREVQQAICPGQ